MNIKFSLRLEKKSKKTGLVPVIVTVYHEGIRVRKNIPNVKVLKEHWDHSNQRIKPSKKQEEYNFAHEHNSQLDEIKSRISNYWGICLVTKEHPTEDRIIKSIEGKENNSEIQSQDFIQVYKSYIEQSKSHRAERTIIGYTTTLNLIELFYAHQKRTYNLDEIDLRFFDDFRNYCFEEKKYLNNYFAKIINNIKACMNWAKDRNLHNNTNFEKFKAHEENIEVVYLTKDELFHFYNYKFDSKKLAKVRDIYCFSCFTGLRYSDLSNLKPSHIYENIIKLNVEKTRDKDQIIPLSKYAKSILATYKDTQFYPLPMISSQKLNEYIKEACRVAEINSPVTISRYSGKSKIEKTVPKHDLLTLHTARKTFVTNSLVLGMNQMIIRSITGHLSDSSFRRYVKVADNVKSNELTKFWDNID